MFDKEIFKKVRKIQIRTSRMVTDALSGEYHSVFKGLGMEFDEVREYQPGDDVRTIDWNVTARTGKPHIKKFVEEREMTVMFMVDASQSELFGTQQQFKNELAAEICAVLAFSAIKNNDKIGLIVFTDNIELYIPPKKGKKHVLRLIKEVLSFQAKGEGTNIQVALEYLNSILKRKSVTFLISDFIDSDYKRALQVSNKRHDLIAVTLNDRRDTSLSDIGIVEIFNPETGETFLVDTSCKKTRTAYENIQKELFGRRDALFRSCDVDEIAIYTGEPYISAIHRFFKMRAKRL